MRITSGTWLTLGFIAAVLAFSAVARAEKPSRWVADNLDELVSLYRHLHQHPANRVNSPNDLMTKHHRQLRRSCSAFDLIKLGVANAARRDLDEKFVWPWLRDWQVDQFQWRIDFAQ